MALNAEHQTQIKKIEELTETSKDVDLLIDTVSTRDKEIEDLKLKLDDSNTYEIMVEKLTQQVLSKESDVETVKKEKAEMEELYKLDEVLIEESDQLKKGLEDDIEKKNSIITQTNSMINKLKESMQDIEATNKNYQMKNKELNEKIESLNSQLKALNDDEKNKLINSHFEKIQSLSRNLREVKSKIVLTKLSDLNLYQYKSKNALYSAFLPKQLIEQSKIDLFDKYMAIYIAGERVSIISNEAISKYFLSNDIDAIRPQIFYYLVKILTLLLDFQKYISNVDYALTQLEETELGKALSAISNPILAFGNIMDSFCMSITEEKFSIENGFYESLTSSFKIVTDVVSKTLNLNFQNYRAELMHSLRLLDLSVCSLGYAKKLSSADEFKIFKIHNNQVPSILSIFSAFPSHDIMPTMGALIDVCIQFKGKYSVSSVLFSDNQSDNTDWKSWIDAAERNINQFIQSSEYTTLSNIKDLSIIPNGAWKKSAEKIKEEVAQLSVLQGELAKCKEENKEMTKSVYLLQKDLEEQKTIRKLLEIRLTEAQQKAERVALLDRENKKLIDKEKNYQSTLDEQNKDLNNLLQEHNNLKLLHAELEKKVNETPMKRKLSKDHRMSIKEKPFELKTIADSSDIEYIGFLEVIYYVG